MSVENVRQVREALAVLRWAAGSSWEFDAAGAASGTMRDPGPTNVKVYRGTLRIYGLFMMQSPLELVDL
jgi:hypothetical protein